MKLNGMEYKGDGFVEKWAPRRKSNRLSQRRRLYLVMYFSTTTIHFVSFFVVHKGTERTNQGSA